MAHSQRRDRCGRIGVAARAFGIPSTTVVGHAPRYRRPMIARSSLDALTRAPLRFLRSSWPWRSLAYLSLSALPVALAIGAVVVAESAGIESAGLGRELGIAGFAALLLGTPLIAVFERWRIRFVDGDPVQAAPKTGLAARLRGSDIWRELAHALVAALALWWIDLSSGGDFLGGAGNAAHRAPAARRHGAYPFCAVRAGRPAAHPAGRLPDHRMGWRARRDDTGHHQPARRAGRGPALARPPRRRVRGRTAAHRTGPARRRPAAPGRAHHEARPGQAGGGARLGGVPGDRGGARAGQAGPAPSCAS